MWNDESVTFGYDTKPKVERLGFLSQSESFGYGNNSQMSFLNDDTDNIIQNGNKQDDFLNELDPFSPQPFDNDIPLVDDDDSNSAVYHSEKGADIVDQNEEQFPSISEDHPEELNLLEDKNSNNDVRMETITESNVTNDQVNSVKGDKEEEVVKKKRKTPTNKTKWPQDPADCDICGTHYTTKRSFQRHYKIVHELRYEDCKHCDKQFKWPGKLLEHTKLVHLGIQRKTYPCDKCDKVWTAFRSLKHHMAREHPPPGCESCKVSFNDMEGLQEHIRVEHLQKYCNN